MRRIFRKPARFKIDPLCAQDKIFYVLNPDQNLSATQKKLEGELTSLGSEGRVGEHPSLPEMKRVLSEMDAFMYCGHGTSAKSMPENVRPHWHCSRTHKSSKVVVFGFDKF